MEFFKHSTHIDFLGIRKWTSAFSILLIVISAGILLTKGINWGLDFTGGTQVQIIDTKIIDLEKMRIVLEETHLKEINVQAYGNAKSALIRVGEEETLSQQEIAAKIKQALPEVNLVSVEYIGPQVGEELTTDGILALVVAVLATMAYIAIRFEWRFSVSAIVALMHDPILVLGVFSLMQIEFDLIALAAILTVIGYSLNDTIVVFDRVRENFRKMRKATTLEVVNTSVNQTLSRTIITSLLTLLAVMALFYFGGERLHGFATALMIGIIVGTYSSIYIAGALAVVLGVQRANLLVGTPALADEGNPIR